MGACPLVRVQEDGEVIDLEQGTQLSSSSLVDNLEEDPAPEVCTVRPTAPAAPAYNETGAITCLLLSVECRTWSLVGPSLVKSHPKLSKLSTERASHFSKLGQKETAPFWGWLRWLVLAAPLPSYVLPSVKHRGHPQWLSLALGPRPHTLMGESCPI